MIISAMDFHIHWPNRFVEKRFNISRPAVSWTGFSFLLRWKIIFQADVMGSARVSLVTLVCSWTHLPTVTALCQSDKGISVQWLMVTCMKRSAYSNLTIAVRRLESYMEYFVGVKSPTVFINIFTLHSECAHTHTFYFIL